VYWVNDVDVPFCPSCGSQFGIARRRHHCRLCGSIMCTKCSMFISQEFSNDLIKTLSRSSESSRARSVSFDTTVKVNPNILQTRICIECLKILEKRKERRDQIENTTLLFNLYQKLQSSIIQANKLAPEYHKMAESLNQGDEEFQLDRAQELRIQLVRFYDVIEAVSKKITTLSDGDDQVLKVREVKIQSNIRRSAYAYLQVGLDVYDEIT